MSGKSSGDNAFQFFHIFGPCHFLVLQLIGSLAYKIGAFIECKHDKNETLNVLKHRI
jgi:hypothetical protein